MRGQSYVKWFLFDEFNVVNMNKSQEEEIKRFWESHNIYSKLSKKGKKFYFLDGPPYATGNIHMGTAWNKILKDVYIRFWRVTGLNVWDQPGYDTHGLPIENKVEKDSQIKSKSDIERLGIEKFIHECRKFATKYIDIMNRQFADLGVWMDWPNPYLTLANEYIEGAWHTFKIAFDKGLLYQGFYPVHVCPHCATAVAYNEIEYTKVSDPSVYVKFPVKGEPNTFLLIWTTTPWTLPSNTGIMAKPSADYVRVEADGDKLILAKELLEDVMKRAGITSYKIVENMKGGKLSGMEYDHPLKDIFKFQEPVKHRIVLSEQYVELESGTGLVHTAPGHGQEDYKIGIENGLTIISPVKLNGTFNEECGPVAGKYVKDADREIINILKERGLLLHEEKITHDYPLCWRCNSPLLEMAVNQWFFRVTQIRNQLLKENKKVNWHPEWAGQRFENWLKSLGDWPVSRQRYWGIPLPIWTCECGEIKVIGSTDELPAKPKDLHRPYIDEIRLVCKCGKEMKRIPDVLDVWFDSGLASWASLGYPNKKELFESMWPADLNIEGPDQIRGWWNSQLITSIITFGKAPFKNILFHGFVLDAHGTKMSKSKGNIVSPEEVVDKYGRDVLRLYLLSSPPWDDFYFKWIDVERIAKSFVVMENTYNYVKTYAPKAKKVKKLEPEDVWLLSRLNNTIEEVTKQFKSYNVHRAANALTDFLINDFSRIYIKMVRDRAWPTYEGPDKTAAHYTLNEVAKIASTLLAPLCPFFAERAHKLLNKKEESVHLCKWPKPMKKLINMQIEKEMELVNEIIEVSNAVRKENNIKVRWPVESVYIESDDETVKSALITFERVLKSMTNTKSVSMGRIDGHPKQFSKGTLHVSKKILKVEGLLRELLREVQAQRKKYNLDVNDRIILYLDNESMKEYEKEIKHKVGAREIHFGPVGSLTGKAQLEEEIVNFKIEALEKNIHEK